jgi:hypothetical protein
VWPGGLGKLKKFIHLIETGTRDLPTCSIAPQPTTVPRSSYASSIRSDILLIKFLPSLLMQRHLTKLAPLLSTSRYPDRIYALGGCLTEGCVCLHRVSCEI